MTLKNAALFALIGMVLITLIGTANLIVNISGAIRGFIPVVSALTALIQFVGDLSLLVFFAVFHRAQ